jgi:hypothetical protein
MKNNNKQNFIKFNNTRNNNNTNEKEGKLITNEILLNKNVENSFRRLETIQNHLFSSSSSNSSSSLPIHTNESLIIKKKVLSRNETQQQVSNNFDENNNFKLRARIEPSVQYALLNKKPVVALESTIITHGMPYPKNIETARKVEETIREQGATPATICILDGIIHVGITLEQMDRLGKLGSNNVQKCSRRDLALVCSQQAHGATTVSGTMFLANMFGIRIFVVSFFLFSFRNLILRKIFFFNVRLVVLVVYIVF